MWVQWSEQREYMDISWGCGWFLATMFVLVNLVGQLGAVGMVLTRFKVDIACGVLFFIVILQVGLYCTCRNTTSTCSINFILPRLWPIVSCGTFSSCSVTWL